MEKKIVKNQKKIDIHIFNIANKQVIKINKLNLKDQIVAKKSFFSCHVNRDVHKLVV